MLISIVIPARNEEKYIAACLKSLKEQSYDGAYEIIVVDNGSTDNTAAIARSFDGVRVIPDGATKSVFYARQVGADEAKGDIIVQADGDTVYPPQWLQRLSDKLSSHPKAAGVSGRFFYADKFAWSWLEIFVRNILNIIFAFLFGRPFLVSGATFAFRRSAFNTAGGYRGLTYSADQYGLAKRLKPYGKVLYDSGLYVYTSARRVRKSVFRLLRDIAANIYHLSAFGLGSFFTPTPTRRHPVRRAVTWGVCIIAAGILAFSAVGYFVPAAPVFGTVYHDADTNQKVIALTFDDGPNEPYTSEILDILKENNIHATFFLIGKNAELYPDTARRIVAEGNVVGNHTFSHDPNHALDDYASKDIAKGEQAIYSVTGVMPHLYRPPNGKKSPWEAHNLKEDNLIEITWSDTANDQHVVAYWGKPKVTNYAQAIINHAKPGAIILMHDGFGTLHNSARSDKSLAVKALPIIISQLKAKGYTFVTVPQLIGVTPYLKPTTTENLTALLK